MASTSPDASEIRRRGRQRLIGAVAIALLLIVFVPMLLDSEPRKARDEPKLDIPAKENAPPLPAPPPGSSAPPR
jgi:DedD protein